MNRRSASDGTTRSVLFRAVGPLDAHGLDCQSLPCNRPHMPHPTQLTVDDRVFGLVRYSVLTNRMHPPESPSAGRCGAPSFSSRAKRCTCGSCIRSPTGFGLTPKGVDEHDRLSRCRRPRKFKVAGRKESDGSRRKKHATVDTPCRSRHDSYTVEASERSSQLCRHRHRRQYASNTQPIKNTHSPARKRLQESNHR
jgi:hypothetical protein